MGLIPAQTWDPERAGLLGPGEVPAVREDHDRFVIPILLEEEPGRIRVANYVVPKMSFDEWWGKIEGRQDENTVRVAASETYTLPVPGREGDEQANARFTTPDG